MKRVRTRYAPSPTGHLHIGNARTAMFTYLFAKHNNGDFIIRIEDTDIARNVENGEVSQFQNLKWLGINWSEGPDVGGEFGPYRQLERLDIYKEHIDKLIATGHAYKCYCTDDELAQERERQAENGETPRYSGKCKRLSIDEEAELSKTRDFAIRMRVDENAVYTFEDMVRGEITFLGKDIGDWVAIKKNGIPTYNFACAIDDHLMEISHVFRGEEHISNTPKQMMVYEALGFEAPVFAHMAIIVNESKKKLSKRDESILQFIEQYRDLGYVPEAMFNFIGLLGWSPVGEDEIFTKDQFIEIFDAHRLGSAPAMFDKEKLKWINNRYFKHLSAESIEGLCLPFILNVFPNIEHRFAKKLIGLFREQLSYGEEIIELVSPYTKPFALTDGARQFLQENDVKETILLLRSTIEKTEFEFLTVDGVKEMINLIKTEANVKGKMLFMPIRIAISGFNTGPDLNSVVCLFSKDEIIKRINTVLEEL